MSQKTWGGRFERRNRRARRSVHRVDQLRPPALSPRHPRQPGPCADARRGRAAHAGEAEQIVAALDEIGAEIEAREDGVLHRARRHSHAHRTGADREARRRRPQAAHRPQPQRPGRHRRQALGPRRHRRTRRPAARICRGPSSASAERERDVVLPGYTHLQRAQPVLAAHYFLAYVEKFQRDRDRLADCRKRVNVLPLGAAALAGTSLPIDRESVRQQARLRLGGAATASTSPATATSCWSSSSACR